MGTSTRSGFATKLRDAVAACGKSTQQIVRELDEAGFTVPERALKNWLDGYFLPRSKEAGEVVFALEKVVGVPQSSLVQAVAVDLASGRAFVPGEDARDLAPVAAEVVDGVIDRKFARSDGETDWAAELVRVAIEDEIVVAADFRNLTHKIVTVARVPAVPNPTLNAPVVYEATDVPTHPRLIHGIEGARLAGQKVYEMDGGQVNVTSRLELPGEVNPGELHRVVFVFDLERSRDIERVSERVFAWPLRTYRCRVVFRGAVPQDIEHVFVDSVGDGESGVEKATRIEAVDGVAEIVRRDCGKGLGWMRWTVPGRE